MNRTKIIIALCSETVWKTRFFYLINIFRRHSRLLMFARINSRVTSINHSLHIKRPVAKDEKNMGLRVFFFLLVTHTYSPKHRSRTSLCLFYHQHKYCEYVLCTSFRPPSFIQVSKEEVE